MQSHPTEKVGWLFLCQKIISKKFLLSGTFCVSDLGGIDEGALQYVPYAAIAATTP